MIVVAGCSLSEAVGVNGRLVTVDEEGNKSDKVLLNVEIKEDDTDVPEKVAQIPKSSIKCFTVFGSGRVVSDLPVFRVYTLEEALESIDTEYIPLVKLSNDFPNETYNMRTLYELSVKYPKVRFIGGRVLGIMGIQVGRFDDGKSKMSVNFSDVYDNFVEVRLSELSNLKEITKKSRKKLEDTEEKPKKKKAARVLKEHKPSKATKRAEAFSNLFAGVEEVEF